MRSSVDSFTQSGATSDSATNRSELKTRSLRTARLEFVWNEHSQRLSVPQEVKKGPSPNDCRNHLTALGT